MSIVLNGTSSQISGVPGLVLQVVQAEYATQVSLSSITYTDTGLSATITPTSTSSKILVLISQNLYIYREFAFQYGYLQLLLIQTTHRFLEIFLAHFQDRFNIFRMGMIVQSEKSTICFQFV